MTRPSSAKPEGRAELELSDVAIVRATLAGENWAARALFQRYSPLALGLAHRFLPREADADDLVQDCFLYAFQRLATLENHAAFASWLATIVVRTAGKRSRRQRVTEQLRFCAWHPADVDVVAARDAPPDVLTDLRTFDTALARFPAVERMALVLRRVEGQRHAEIAEYVGVSESTVKRKLRRAEARLARLTRR